jgi:hypothetical protein
MGVDMVCVFLVEQLVVEGVGVVEADFVLLLAALFRSGRVSVVVGFLGAAAVVGAAAAVCEVANACEAVSPSNSVGANVAHCVSPVCVGGEMRGSCR